MPECPYCDRSFERETAIREHFYVDHDREELGRIDTRRVEQYLRDHGVAEPEPAPDLTEVGSDFESTFETVREMLSPWDPTNQSHPEDVREMSTNAITDRLADLGIYSDRGQFRQQAEEYETVHALVSSWFDDDWVTATGYERDFVWMAGVVLWDRWADDVQRSERIVELSMEADELEATGDHLAAYERLLDAWEEFLSVSDPDVISLQAAIDGWDGPVDLPQLCLALAHPAENNAWGDANRAEMRLGFCRDVLERFPAIAVSVHRLMRLGEADALFVLGRTDEADEVYESIVEANPADARIYAEWGTRYRQGCPPANIPGDEERATEIFSRGREANAEPGEILIELLDRPQDVEHPSESESSSNEGPVENG
jgi:tetratricopeptide (TPR) repeat protein